MYSGFATLDKLSVIAKRWMTARMYSVCDFRIYFGAQISMDDRRMYSGFATFNATYSF